MSKTASAFRCQYAIISPPKRSFIVDHWRRIKRCVVTNYCHGITRRGIWAVTQASLQFTPFMKLRKISWNFRPTKSLLNWQSANFAIEYFARPVSRRSRKNWNRFVDHQWSLWNWRNKLNNNDTIDKLDDEKVYIIIHDFIRQPT